MNHEEIHHRLTGLLHGLTTKKWIYPVSKNLLGRWGSGDRVYHDLSHLSECLVELDEAIASGFKVDNAASVELAIFYHDAVYDVWMENNEEQSYELLKQHLTHLGIPRYVELRGLILATRHISPPETTDQALLMDIDLARLLAEPTQLREYSRQLRLEYGCYSDAEYRSGRTDFLNKMLARERLLYSDRYKDREPELRANLKQLLQDLKPAVGPC